MKKIIYLLMALFVLVSCSDDTQDPEPSNLPVITWVMAGGRYTMQAGEFITLVPDVENLDETSTWTWTMDGEVISTENSYTFTTDSAGVYYIQLVVTNRYGKAEDEIRITVKEPEEPEDTTYVVKNDSTFAWRFPQTTYNVSQGRNIKVKAYFIENAGEATYTWKLDGNEVAGSADEVSYVFQASQQGTHQLSLTMKNDTAEVTQHFTINVCPPAGTYRRTASGGAMVNRIFEYNPAPGHQVNGYTVVGESFPDNCTHEQACDTVLAHFARHWMISLGGQGGYLLAGFDHSVTNSNGDYDLVIQGNDNSYQSEPGIIWVSQDENGDGLPNDTWFELRGSEYGTSNETLEYAITYYKPTRPRNRVIWHDNEGGENYIPYMSYWNPKDYYWQPWQLGTEMTFFGSRLADHSTYTGGYSDIPPYEWGYVDNAGSDTKSRKGYFKISNAVTWDGKDANLEYIDFVRIQTGQTGHTPNLGEISTEVYYIGDYHLEQ